MIGFTDENRYFNTNPRIVANNSIRRTDQTSYAETYMRSMAAGFVAAFVTQPLGTDSKSLSIALLRAT